jgi:hypothetical protein
MTCDGLMPCSDLRLPDVLGERQPRPAFVNLRETWHRQNMLDARNNVRVALHP